MRESHFGSSQRYLHSDSSRVEVYDEADMQRESYDEAFSTLSAERTLLGGISGEH
jgi:hypothetical protein